MFGKHFGSMYEGSLVGAGAVVFAVLGYIIAKQMPSKKYGSQVELNPVLLAFILGETEKNVAAAIDFLCEPDKKSRTPDKGGRRLVKLGEYAYQVVNGAKYRAIRDEEQRQASNREAKRRERSKGKGPSSREQLAMQAEKNGDHETAEAITDGSVPPVTPMRSERDEDDICHPDLQ